MAVWYVYSGRSGTSTGYGTTDRNDPTQSDNWTEAFTDFAEADANVGAGDTVYVHHSHTAGYSSTTTIDFSSSTSASPIFVICVNASTGAYATTAVENTTVGNLTVNGYMFIRGVSFQAAQDLYFGTAIFNHIDYEDGTLEITGTGSADYVWFGSGSSQRASTYKFKNVFIKFGQAAQNISFNGAYMEWDGGGLSGVTSTADLFVTTLWYMPSVLYAWGLDLSTHSGDLTDCDGSGNRTQHYYFFGCKMNASVGLQATNASWQGICRLVDCSGTNGVTQFWETRFQGYSETETTIVRTGGASDGTTSFSRKIVTGAAAVKYFNPLRVLLWEGWIDTTSSKTIDIHTVHDSAGAGTGSHMQNDEAWIEVVYQDDTTCQVFVEDDRVADARASVADQATSTESWTTTGITSPVYDKLSVTTGNTGKPGQHQIWLCVGVPSTTLYACPLPDIA